MIPLKDRQLVYEFLMLDVVIRSLQHDIEHMQKLKFFSLYEQQLGTILNHLQRDMTWRKNRLAGSKIRLSKWVKVNENFSDAILATAGEDVSIRFSTHVLKQNSYMLIEQRMMPIEQFNE